MNALGLAMFCFARLEWQVVWSCERIIAGSVRKFVSEELTAGQIAKKFVNVVRNMPPSNVRDALQEIAAEFSHLVDERNRIAHGKPCTSSHGDQRLSAGTVIELADLEKAADSFADCASRLNGLYYQYLNPAAQNGASGSG